MHMGDSSRMRGASIVGVVFVLAFLSVAAITLDTLSSSKAQFAATTAATTPSVPEQKSTDEPQAVNGACEMGYDYVIRLNKENATAIAAAKNDSKGRPTVAVQNKTEADRCPAAGKQASDGSQRICSQVAWECRVAYCQPKRDASGKVQSTINNPDQETCITIAKRSKVGESIDPKTKKDEAYADAAKQAALPTGSSQRDDAIDFLKGSNYSESQGLLGAFDTAEKDNAQKLADITKSETDAQAKIKAWENSYCIDAHNSDDPSAAVGYGCTQKKQEYLDAKAKLPELEAQKATYAREAGRLDGLKKELVSSKSTDSDTGEIQSDSSSIATTFNSNNPGSGTGGCPPGDFLCRNTNQPGPTTNDINRCQQRPPDMAACQRVAQAQAGGYGQQVVVGSGYGATSGGNDPYCVTSNYPLIVEQRPAMPGCLNYRQQQQQGASQQCGSQQQQGGLIGTIISLFKKSNSNSGSSCVNGVPVPSCTLTASPKNVSAAGQQVTLSWQSQNAYSASLSNSGSVAVQGSITITPQTTTTYTLALGGYMDNQTGRQLQGQCSTQVTVGGSGGDSAGTPHAQIACQPQAADVGMSIAISFACQGSLASSGTGFTTNNQMSGSATPIITAPTLGSDTVTYGLTCSNQGKTDAAQCTVQINKPSIVLVANPKNLHTGEDANVGWITNGMDSCVVSSPTLAGFTADNANNTDVSGVVKTPALSQTTKFMLSCTTHAGGTKTAEAIVEVN
jgi:hypothetical protein